MFDWTKSELQLTLLEMRVEARTIRRKGNTELVEHFLEAGLLTRTPRRNEVEVTESGKRQVHQLIDRVWPEWEEVLARLDAGALPRTARNIEAMLRAIRRPSLHAPLPPRLNQKTYNASQGRHSKVRYRQPSVEGVQITHDGILRMRAPEGMVLRSGPRSMRCGDMAALAGGEILIPERALLDGLAIEGTLPSKVLTVENLAAFLDLASPPDCLTVHVPGLNSTLAIEFIRRLPTVGQSLRFIHFGDLDPNGLNIYAHLRDSLASDMTFLVPPFWEEYVEGYWQPLDGDWSGPPLPLALSLGLHALVERGIWLEQECFLLDARLTRELAD